MTKIIFTLNVAHAYSQAVTDLTYPFLKAYAHKIGADFYVIHERKFPQWPEVYEKMQIYELAEQMRNDWNIYIDCDALVHPDMPDITCHLPMDTVAHNGSDLNTLRWKWDRYFQRDGRFIGSCNWFTLASSWCTDLWHPLEDMTPDQVAASIFPIVAELQAGITPIRLVDDYVLSRNIARYGLKFKTIMDILKSRGFDPPEFLFHLYAIPPEEKVAQLKTVMKQWRLA